jgi:uncharacterized membrane protein required for colicin V production
MSRSDRVIGIVLGLLIGIVALILFVFLGSQQTIDAPSLQTTQQEEATREATSP